MENNKDKKLIITPLSGAKKVSQVLANDTCRAILDAVSDEPLSASQIAEKMNLPLTTVDYNLKRLSSVGLISVHHKRWSPKGKKVNYYAPAEKFILITPKLRTEKIFSTLKTLIPVIALIGLAVGVIGFYSLQGEAPERASYLATAGGENATVAAEAAEGLAAAAPSKFVQQPAANFWPAIIAILLILAAAIIIAYISYKKYKK